jgi:hypothetical protein
VDGGLFPSATKNSALLELKMGDTTALNFWLRNYRMTHQRLSEMCAPRGPVGFCADGDAGQRCYCVKSRLIEPPS